MVLAVLKFAPVVSALVATIVLFVGNNVVQSYFTPLEIQYRATVVRSPAGTGRLRIENISRTTCEGRIETRFAVANAKIVSAKIMDSNEKPVTVTVGRDQKNLIVEADRLANRTGFIALEFAYTEMTRDGLEIRASDPVVGCKNGAYELVSRLRPSRFNPVLFMLIAVAAAAVTVLAAVFVRLRV